MFSSNMISISQHFLYVLNIIISHDSALLVVLGFNATFTHIMAVGDAQVFPGFLTPVLIQLSFQSHRLLFSHASEVRGENTPERKIASTVNRSYNHQVTRQTISPLGHPDGTMIEQPVKRNGFFFKPIIM